MRMISKLMVNEHHRKTFDRSTAGWATQQLTVVCSNRGMLGIHLYIYIYRYASKDDYHYLLRSLVVGVGPS